MNEEENKVAFQKLLEKCSKLLKQNTNLKYFFTPEGEPIYSYLEIVESQNEALVISKKY
jgi:transcription initiation factor IIE alpha subunit